MAARYSQDTRCKLERAFVEIARADPSAPADMEDTALPMRAALCEDAAVQMPGKCCGCKACDWAGKADEDWYAHCSKDHHAFLAKAADLLQEAYTMEALVQFVVDSAGRQGVRAYLRCFRPRFSSRQTMGG